MRPVLEVKNLIKDYHTPGRPQFRAVNGITFSINRGECVGILGPNGAGKSTTIQCITGFYPCTQGLVEIEGLDVHKQPKLARSHLGVCAQDDNLDTDFSVQDQLIRHATYFRIPVTQAKTRADELLKEFGLTDKKDLLIEELSGGMRRRLQVARALVAQPQLLLLDEPTTGLDPDARRSLWEVLVRERARGTGILLSTHYMDEAERLCDRVILLYRGQILDLDTPSNLIQKHVGTEPIRDEVRPGAVWVRPPNLEDVFLKLSGSKLESGSSEASP